MANIRGTSSGMSPNLVGVFIRSKREALGLSQRALGLLFEPAVTTQFISNIERGVTPLPPVHIATLVRALQVPENELIQVMEREYAAKISQRVGRNEPVMASTAHPMRIAEEDRPYFQALYDAYRLADLSGKEAFHALCESLLRLPKPGTKPVPK